MKFKIGDKVRKTSKPSLGKGEVVEGPARLKNDLSFAGKIWVSFGQKGIFPFKPDQLEMLEEGNMDILEKIDLMIAEAQLGSVGTIGFKVGDNVAFGKNKGKVADKNKLGQKAPAGFYDKAKDAYLVNFSDGTSQYVPTMELMKEDSSIEREEEKRNIMVDYLVGMEAHASRKDKAGTKEEFQNMEQDELERTYETYGGVVSELDSLVENDNSKTYPSKQEMVQYLLDSSALFHNEEGTRSQFENMDIEDLKVYYDDTKASE